MGITLKNTTYKYLALLVINSIKAYKKDISTPQWISIVHGSGLSLTSKTGHVWDFSLLEETDFHTKTWSAPFGTNTTTFHYLPRLAFPGTSRLSSLLVLLHLYPYPSL